MEGWCALVGEKATIIAVELRCALRLLQKTHLKGRHITSSSVLKYPIMNRTNNSKSRFQSRQGIDIIRQMKRRMGDPSRRPKQSESHTSFFKHRESDAISSSQAY